MMIGVDTEQAPLGAASVDSDYNESNVLPLNYKVLKKEVVVEISFGDDTTSLNGAETATGRVFAERKHDSHTKKLKLNVEGTVEAVKASGSGVKETNASRLIRTHKPAKLAVRKVVPEIMAEWSTCYKVAAIKEEPMDFSNKDANEQACVHENKNPSGVEHHARATENNQAEIVMKTEPNNLDGEVMTTEEPTDFGNENANEQVCVQVNKNPSDVELNARATQNIVIKIEPANLDEEVVTTGDHSVNVAEDVRLTEKVAVKHELEFEHSVLQPPDVRYVPRPCKPEPAEKTMPIAKEFQVPQGHKALVLKGEDHTQEQSNDQHMHNFPSSLSQGMSGPTSERYTPPAKRVLHPAHTETSKQINPIAIKLLGHATRISAPIVNQDATTRKHADFTTSTHGENPSNVVRPNTVFSLKSNFLDKMLLHNYKLYSQNIKKISQQKISNNSSHSANHTRVHADEKPFECESCGKRFSQRSSLNMHMHIHTDPYTCEYCEKKYSNNSHLARHMRVHTDVKPFECKFCDERFRQNSHLIRHMRVHSGEKPFECQSCSKRFSNHVSLIRHIRVHTGEKYFQCKSCDKKFRDKSTLDLHMRVHTGEKPFECKSCDKKFTQSSHLNRHVLVHIDEKPFEPESCSNTSPITDIGVHADETYFVCKFCGRRFCDKSTLAKHLRVHTGEKPFECGSCDKKFTQSSHLNRHMQVHTGEKPFECDFCGKRFSQRVTLITHIRVHTPGASQSGEKHYRCDACDKRFIHNSTLVKHVRVHTGEKPFECKSCGKKFSQSSHIKRHMRVHTFEKSIRC